VAENIITFPVCQYNFRLLAKIIQLGGSNKYTSMEKGGGLGRQFVDPAAGFDKCATGNGYDNGEGGAQKHKSIPVSDRWIIVAVRFERVIAAGINEVIVR